MAARAHNAHDYAQYEAKIKTYVTLGDAYHKLVGNRVVPLTDEDRAFLIEWGHLEAPE
jgi:hypothetical protein